MKQDRVTVGLSPRGQTTIAKIMALGWFDDQQDVARLALALAIRAKSLEGEAVDTDTRWGAGGFDSSGEIRSIVLAHYPSCQAPVRLMEHLVDVGLRLIDDKLSMPDVSPATLMA